MDWTRDRVDESKADIAVMTLETRPLSFSVRADGELAWTEEVEPSPAISEALEDDMNSSLATSYLLSKVQSVRSDAERRQVVHDIRFLGLFDLKKLEYLTGARSLSHVPADRSLAVSTLARDFAVASANNDPVFAGQLRTNLEKQGVHIDLATGGVHAAYVGIAEKTAETLVAARIAARKAKNFAEADRIRAELDAMGIALKDAKDPATGELVTTWEVKR
jgi:cysteinyl-tRNA synthetase